VSDARCEEYRELVSAFVDERLDGGELLRLEAHVASCAGCRDFEVELRRFRGLLQAAETFRPLRTPPPGFAAMVAARVERLPRAEAVPFPEVRARRRALSASWLGMAAAAAAAVLFFTWSRQRLIDGDTLAQQLAGRPAGKAVVLAASPADGGDIEAWLREHAMDARDGTLLGPAEEVEFASFSARAFPGR
jgi:predicted anti-sigma-YlaC factor YlaD